MSNVKSKIYLAITANCHSTLPIYSILNPSDTEKPQLYCPPNKEINKNASTMEVMVFWEPPTVFDNSGSHVKTFTEAVNGSKRAVGEYTIIYTANDDAGNKAECSFIIAVASKCQIKGAF